MAQVKMDACLLICSMIFAASWRLACAMGLRHLRPWVLAYPMQVKLERGSSWSTSDGDHWVVVMLSSSSV